MNTAHQKKEIKYRVGKDLHDQKEGALKKYCRLILGSSSLLKLIRFELIMLICQNMPGALGLLLRSMLYPMIFKSCGKKVVFGQSITFRHPEKISIGNHVIIDDNCMVDAKGEDNEGIEIEDHVFIGRNSILSSKNGNIILRKNVNIGFNSYIFSGHHVELGENTLVAAYCYFIGGDHGTGDVDENFYDQSCDAYGIQVGQNCWFGAGVKIQDNTRIGSHSIIGTQALVTKNIPEYSVAVGIPAKVVKNRKGN